MVYGICTKGFQKNKDFYGKEGETGIAGNQLFKYDFPCNVRKTP